MIEKTGYYMLKLFCVALISFTMVFAAGCDSKDKETSPDSVAGDVVMDQAGMIQLYV